MENILSESEEEEDELIPADGGAGGEGHAPVEKAVVQLTRLVSQMAKQKSKKSGLEAVLERVEASGGAEGSSGLGSSGRSKAGAYKRLKAALVEKPEWISKSVEAMMEEDFNVARSRPAAELVSTSSRAWVEHRSKLQHYNLSIRFAWAVAGIHDCLKQGRVEEARSRCCLTLAAIDQSSIDNGSWTLAQEILLEQAAPFASFVGRRGPDLQEQPASRLLDERLLEVVIWRQRQRPIHREQEETWSCREVHPATRGRRRPPEGCTYAQAKAKVEEQRKRRSSRGTRGRGRSGRVKMKEDGKEAGGSPRILRVPGAGASVVHARIWDLVFSALLRARTGLSSFLHSMLANRAHVQRAQERRVWPMPLPFPEVFRRKKSRDSYEGQRKMGLNFIILVLDWLHVGEQLVSVDLFRLGCPLNKAQWAVVKRLTPLIDSWNSQNSIGPEEMGRCAAKVESVEEELAKLEEAARGQQDEMRRYFGHREDRPRCYGATGHPGRVVGKLTGGLQHVAKDLDPGRLKFHGVPVLDMRTAREARAERGRNMKKLKKKTNDSLALRESEPEDEEPEVRAAEARGRKKRREGGEVEAEGRSTEAEITEADESRRTEDESRRTEAESRRTEAESRRTEDEGRRTEAESRRTEAESRRTEAEERWTEADGAANGKGASSSSGGGVSVPLWLEEVLSYKESQFVYDKKKYADLRSAVLSGPGLLDLYSGARGFAKAFVNCGCPWALRFDLKHGEDEDLLLPRIQSSLRRLVSLGSFLAMAAGPVCASFSTAITPAWRTKEHPLGRPELGAQQKLKLQLGHQQLAFALELCELCLKHGVRFLIENPAGSWFWKMPGRLSWSKILTTQDVDDFLVDQCRCGTAWRKRTRFRTTSHLGGQRLMCQCKQKHTVLRGRCKEKGVNFTKLAESYPRKLCSILAGAMAIDCGLLPLRRAISVADCVRDDNKRIGEAGNPGPRRAQTKVREVDLDDVQLLEPQTIAMRSKLWKTFIEWVANSLGHTDIDEAMSAPDYFVKILEAYGRKLYGEGAPLHYFRQLLAHVQRERPGLRAHTSSAWLLVSRWEVAEPMQHRPPLPEPVVEALISLSICWRWPKCGCCILMAFYGICRIGEVVNAAGEDLLTPEDLMDPEEKCYLKIRSPKSRGRGPRVQYTTFAKEKYIKFLVQTWQPLQPKEQLFPYSAASFRRRWDALMSHIGISALHRLTPGTLRGGGAVWAHRAGLGIQELLWKMRLQHQKTLGYYLQEVTALSILPLLPSSCRENIAALRELLPLLIEACHSARERG